MRALLIFLFSFLCSCKSESKLNFHIKVEKFADENFEEHSSIYSKVNIWIEEGIRLNLNNLKSLIFEPNYSVDKLILMNDEKTKIVGTINVADSIWKNTKHDMIYMFWGVKINGIWYFTKGGNLFVPRENYKYNIYEALQHFQLSYIGRDYFLKHFFHINGDHISVNSNLINEHVVLKEGYKDNRDTDKKWMKFFKERYSKIVPQEEIDDINESIKNEVKEEHVLPEKGTKAWKELYGTKVPLFEREEWKAYEAKLKNSIK